MSETKLGPYQVVDPQAIAEFHERCGLAEVEGSLCLIVHHSDGCTISPPGSDLYYHVPDSFFNGTGFRWLAHLWTPEKVTL